MVLGVWYWMLSSAGEVWCRGIKLVCIACRAYKWIVKGGEDVRTDERMEMILDVCNGLLTRHPGAASHRLKVRPHLSMVAVWETMGVVSMPMPAVREDESGPDPEYAARVRRHCTSACIGRR